MGSNYDEVVVSWSSSCIALVGLIGSSHTGMAGWHLLGGLESLVGRRG